MKNKSKLGFSLIELSVVILVIGLLVIGVTKGRAIMTASKVSSAKTLTQNSPVTLISDLVVWYEPVLGSSFNNTVSDLWSTTALTNANGGSWFNNSPYKGNNAIIGTAPDYHESVINNLPAIRFTSGDTLTFKSLTLNQRYYTIFVVEQRRAATGTLVDLGGNVLSYSTNILLGDATVGGSAVTAYATPTPRIDTFISDATTKRSYINGTVGAITGTAGLITATDSGVIGTSFTGDIAEVIIFNRDLKLSERNDIQEYLGKKYDIGVTDSVN